jgi:hypothetical protein
MGAVASPATAEETTRAKRGRVQRGMRPVSTSRRQEKTAMSAMVAAKDIWKPGSVSASGRRVRTMSAARATARSVSARASKRTAASTTATMAKARSVATLPPESAR